MIPDRGFRAVVTERTADRLVDEAVTVLGAERAATATFVDPTSADAAIPLAIRRRLPGATVLAFDVDPNAADALRNEYVQTYPEGFGRTRRPIPAIDAFVMAPPFLNDQDIACFLHAYDRAVRGGVLVGLLGPAIRFRRTRLHERLIVLARTRELIRRDAAEATVHNNGVRTTPVLLVWRKP